MKNFNPIFRDYVAPADLATMEKTYNTLEKGHQDAVRAASDLEIAMANLDLNEAESEWRQNKIDEIRTTIANNTIAGNSYGALDDLVVKAGNIASDAGMIGRLNAQRDFKAYRDNLDKRTDLPEDYKDFFREANGYYYQDQVNKDGRVIGGTKWNPTKREVKTVDLSEIITRGINIAAADSGGGAVVQWLDENGAITSDASKAIDGQYFNTTTSTWTKLGADKIRAGIQAYIESTPGAKESLNQDYEIALWKHNKEQAGLRDDSIVLSDVTDRNGNPLTPQDYLEKRISPAVYAAKYTRTTTNIAVNQNIRREYANGRKKKAASDGTEDLFDMNGGSIPMAPGNTVQKVSTAAADTISAMETAKSNISDIVTRVSGKPIPARIDINDPSKVIGYFNGLLEVAKLDGISSTDLNRIKSQVSEQFRLYEEAAINFSSLRENYTPKGQEAFVYKSEIESGLPPTNDTRYGKQYNKVVGELFDGQTRAVRVSIERPKDFNKLKELLVGDSVSNIEDLGYVVGKLPNGHDYIEVPQHMKHLLPSFSEAVQATEDNIPSFYKMMNDNFTKTQAIVVTRQGFDDEPIEIEYGGGLIGSGERVGSKGRLYEIPKIANRADKRIQKENDNLGVSTVISTPVLYGYATPGEAAANKAYDVGAIDKSRLDVITERENIGLQRVFAPGGIMQYDVYMIQDDKQITPMTKIESSTLAADVAKRFPEALSGNTKSQIGFAMGNNGGKWGLSISIPNEKKGEDPTKLWIPDFYKNDPAMRAYEQLPNSIATQRVKEADSKGLKNIINLVGSMNNSNLGVRQITAMGNGKYFYNVFDGSNTRDIPISEQDAIDVTRNYTIYNNLKNNFDNGIVQEDFANEQQFREALSNLAASISMGSPIDYNITYGEMLSDFGLLN
jgi:hypothetical protein